MVGAVRAGAAHAGWPGRRAGRGLIARVAGDVCRDPARGSRIEWLETNGLGGYAMGTASGIATRRYHALLVAALRPPVERVVVLSRVEETADGVALGVARYPGAIAPEGHRYLEELRLDPFPVWTWRVDGAWIERRLSLVPGENTVVLSWRAERRTRLVVRPLLALRDHHELAREDPAVDRAVERGPGFVRLRPRASLPALTLWHGGARFDEAPDWYRDHEYELERERGLDSREDLYTPGTLSTEVGTDEPAFLVVSIAQAGPWDRRRVERHEDEQRRRRPPARACLAARLDRAADAFRVRRHDGRATIVAGYPWFTDWGRDSMIALPGLLVARGLLDEARDLLAGFLDHLDRGLIPNRFPDRGEIAEYNTVDATLWAFEAMRAILAADPDRRFLREVFYPRAREILQHHRAGTRHGIGVDAADGLLSAGEPGVPLTWMDAKAGDWVVTPRRGKAVEINALWHHALRLTAGWAAEIDGAAEAAALDAEADRVRSSFRSAFWNEAGPYLFDCVDETGPDPRLRPNQIFAVSLRSPLLDRADQQAVVRAVERALRTPFGLRTLGPGEPGYQPRYEGDRVARDGQYHQGTVWPWLLGPLVSAYLRAFGRSPANLARVRGWLAPLERHLDEGCLGQVGEVFDGEPPHRPGGTPAQAWSVAELLRVLVDELGERP